MLVFAMAATSQLPAGAAPPQDSLHFREFRSQDAQLDERKVQLHANLAVCHAEYAQAVHKHDRHVEDTLHQHSKHLAKAISTHRDGFERPHAALAMYEKRDAAHDEKHKEWVQAQIECQGVSKEFQGKYRGRREFDMTRSAQHTADLKELEEVKSKTAALKQAVLAEAAQDTQRYGDHKKLQPQDMQKRQEKLFKELQGTQAQIGKDVEQHRKNAAAMRMSGIQQMQQRQRSLRQHVERDQAQSQLRMTKVMERSQEQRRALSLGTPAWLTPRPTSV